MFYYWWILVAIIIVACSSYFSVKNNLTQHPNWFYLGLAINTIPLWPIVARFSKDIVFDAILYDILLFVSYAFFILLFSGHTITMTKLFGLAIVFIGLLIFKLG